MRKRTLILGMGNELAGDDGVGLHVVRALAEHMAGHVPESVDIEETAGTSLVLLDYLDRYERIIIVDALRGTAGGTGRVQRFDLASGRGGAGSRGLSHNVGPASVLELARGGGITSLPRVTVVGVEVGDALELGEGLSPAVGRAVGEALAVIEEEVTGRRAGAGLPSCDA